MAVTFRCDETVHENGAITTKRDGYESVRRSRLAGYWPVLTERSAVLVGAASVALALLATVVS